MKKTLIIIKNILVGLIVVVAVGMMVFTVFSMNTFNRNDRSILGYKLYIVLSDSMSKTDFSAGDLIIVKNISDFTELKEGDIISYTSQNIDNFGETVTHKIRRAATDEYGNPGFITYGTTTDTDDEKVVTYPYILGIYKTSIPKVGTFFNFLKTTPGYIICILLPFLILILSQGINCVKLFKKYKQEQLEEINQEKEELRKEREKSQEMMAELLELKKQLKQKEEVAIINSQPIETAASEDSDTSQD
ncbi:MAG: signal peptidase I [Clostridia bacterium]|nr:signal peptidase I [Clostridia bacterium]